jgi:hypothetical protein
VSDAPLAFIVELHEYMAARVPGKNPQTVLTIEKMLYSWRLCEYSDPLFIARAWWYESFDEALTALVDFTTLPGNEPQGWLRADDVFEGYSRIRRAKLEFGERVITEDGEKE